MTGGGCGSKALAPRTPAQLCHRPSACTFASYAWSDEPSDPLEACLGDYIGMAALDGRVYAAWVENVPAEQQPRKPPRKIKSGDMEPDEQQLRCGPSAIKVGIASFRS